MDLLHYRKICIKEQDNYRYFANIPVNSSVLTETKKITIFPELACEFVTRVPSAATGPAQAGAPFALILRKGEPEKAGKRFDDDSPRKGEKKQRRNATKEKKKKKKKKKKKGREKERANNGKWRVPFLAVARQTSSIKGPKSPDVSRPLASRDSLIPAPLLPPHSATLPRTRDGIMTRHTGVRFCS
jgi:hypothetical protein